jgi:alpha-ketoglutarate-dependent taurine dioxygenase
MPWPSDSTFETAPSDFSFLKMEETPPHGGDTLWCSGYEIYDRMSPSFRSYLETLTATCSQPVFRSAAKAGSYEIMSPRGSPLNIGDEFAPKHPVVRTNRITGWKAIFAGAGLHVTNIDGVYSHEDQMIRDYVMRLISRNHDCIARMKWKKNSAAIWNNSCVWHAATVCSPCVVLISLRYSSLIPILWTAIESVLEHLVLVKSHILTQNLSRGEKR